MAYTNNLTVLVADNDEASRQYMASLLKTHGYKVIQAIDGGSAMRVVDEHPVDVAIIDHNMTPRTGLEFAKHVIVRGYDIGVIMVTDDPTTDLLIEAGQHDIKQVMRKPLDPDRLSETVRRVLRAHGKNPDALGAGSGEGGGGGGSQAWGPEQLMRHAIALAQQNAVSRMGEPFGAVVADDKGRMIGEGVNSLNARCDPTAYAEIMAIRRATERLGTIRLDGCVLYCSSEPTMMGQALVISTGISKVYYALSHQDLGSLRLTEKGIMGEIAKPLHRRTVPYEKLQQQEAMTMLRTVQAKHHVDSDNK